MISAVVLISNTAFASTNLTLACKVVIEGERTNDVSNPSVSFDAAKEYKALSFDIYGSKISVSATFFTSADGQTCGHEVEQICARLKGSTFCTQQPEATVYSTGKYAQPGDRASIKCELSGDVTGTCPK